MKQLSTFLALLISILGTPTPSLAADEPLPVFIFAGGSNMSGGRSKLETLPQELKGEQANALFFDGTQWLPVSPEKVNKRGFGSEVSFAASMSEKLKRQIGIISWHQSRFRVVARNAGFSLMGTPSQSRSRSQGAPDPDHRPDHGARLR
jgi:hypothetical protein